MKVQKLFILGPGRSGTTLMRSLLDNHPQLSVYPIEVTKFLERIENLEDRAALTVKRFNQILSVHLGAEHFGGILANSLGMSDLDLSAIDNKIFNKELMNGLEDLISVEGYFEHAFKAFHKSFGVNKLFDYHVMDVTAPRIEGYLKSFENAKIIYCTRHPLSCYNSYKKNYYQNIDHLRQARRKGYMLEDFFNVIYSSFEELNKYKDDPRVCIIQLEDLQNNPEQIMKKVTTFLGISYTNTLLKPTLLGKPFSGNTFNKTIHDIVKVSFSDNLLTKQERYLLTKVIAYQKFYDISPVKLNDQDIKFKDFLCFLGNWKTTKKSFPISIFYIIRGFIWYFEVYKSYTKFIKRYFKKYHLSLL